MTTINTDLQCSDWVQCWNELSQNSICFYIYRKSFAPSWWHHLVILLLSVKNNRQHSMTGVIQSMATLVLLIWFTPETDTSNILIWPKTVFCYAMDKSLVNSLSKGSKLFSPMIKQCVSHEWNTNHVCAFMHLDKQQQQQQKNLSLCCFHKPTFKPVSVTHTHRIKVQQHS